MAGWDTLLSPVIYHEPVAPVVPKPDNTAAELISHGTDTAVGAFLRAAQMRQQAEIDQKRMVQDAALTMRGQDITSKDADLRFEVAKENADSLEKSRVDMANWHRESSEDRQRAKDETLKAKTAQADFLTALEAGQNQLDGRAYNDAKPLLDPTLAVDKPGDFVTGAIDWHAKYGMGQTGAVPKLGQAITSRLNSMTVPYARGAELMTADGKSETDDPQNNQIGWYVPKPTAANPQEVVGAKAVAKPEKLIDIYNEYQSDPRGVEKALAAAGHGRIDMVPDPTKNPKGDPDGAFYAKPVLDKWATNLLKSFGQKRATPTNQVPGAYMSTHPEWAVKYGAGSGAEDTPGGSEPPEGDLPEQGGPGQTEGLSGYIPGRSYSGRVYRGGDPHDPANWQ